MRNEISVSGERAVPVEYKRVSSERINILDADASWGRVGRVLSNSDAIPAREAGSTAVHETVATPAQEA